MTISKTLDSLIEKLKDRQIDFDTSVGVVLILKDKGGHKEYERMLDWLDQHPAATSEDIFEELDNIV